MPDDETKRGATLFLPSLVNVTRDLSSAMRLAAILAVSSSAAFSLSMTCSTLAAFPSGAVNEAVPFVTGCFPSSLSGPSLCVGRLSPMRAPIRDSAPRSSPALLRFSRCRAHGLPRGAIFLQRLVDFLGFRHPTELANLELDGEDSAVEARCEQGLAVRGPGQIGNGLGGHVLEYDERA